MLKKVRSLQYDVKTKSMREVEVDIDFPNPRINEINMRLQEIKSQLTEGDIITTKRIEGCISNDVWQAHVKSRGLLRLELNLLEDELEVLND